MSLHNYLLNCSFPTVPAWTASRLNSKHISFEARHLAGFFFYPDFFSCLALSLFSRKILSEVRFFRYMYVFFCSLNTPSTTEANGVN